MNNKSIFKDYSERNNMLKGIGVLVIYLICVSSASIPLEILNINYSAWSDSSLILYSVIYELLLMILFIFIYRKDFFNDVNIFKKDIKGYLNKYIKYWYLALGLMYAASLFVLIFKSGIASNEETVRATLDTAPLYTFILTVMIAPILEELVFRLSFRKMFAKSNWLFIILSGLFFGSMHVFGNATEWSDLLYLLPYSLPGCVFAYTLVKSNNIMVPISIHTIHNGVLVSLQILLMLLK